MYRLIPQAPLHIGHGRGAILGDILARLYTFFGLKIVREFYLNDAGLQIKLFCYSVYLSYLKLCCLNKVEEGKKLFDHFILLHNINVKELYKAEYIGEIAKYIMNKDGSKWLNEYDHNYFEMLSVNLMLKEIKEDLLNIDVVHDEFISEKSVCNSTSYVEVVDFLQSKDLLYRGFLPIPKKDMHNLNVNLKSNVELLLFKSTKFGDDVDRSLEKSDKSRTYFANDVVYHYNKLQRGFTRLINIWGADHVGYIKRMSAAVLALSNHKIPLEVISLQLVNILQNKIPYKMSKRAGNFITLKDLTQQIGKDSLRLLMVSRKNTVPINIDIALVLQSNENNPVFYIQYAYARINSVLQRAREIHHINLKENMDIDFSQLKHINEILLVKLLSKLPYTLKGAILHKDPHRIYNYLLDLATSFHSYWGVGKISAEVRFIIPDNQILTIARLSLLKLISCNIKYVMELLGVGIQEFM